MRMCFWQRLQHFCKTLWIKVSAKRTQFKLDRCNQNRKVILHKSMQVVRLKSTESRFKLHVNVYVQEHFFSPPQNNRICSQFSTVNICCLGINPILMQEALIHNHKGRKALHTVLWLYSELYLLFFSVKNTKASFGFYIVGFHVIFSTANTDYSAHFSITVRELGNTGKNEQKATAEEKKNPQANPYWNENCIKYKNTNKLARNTD